jgi:hypothetical protein
LNNICWGVQIIKPLVQQSPTTHVTSPFFLSNIFVSTLFSITLRLNSSRTVRNQVSNPYKTPGKSMLLKQLLHYLQAFPWN